MKNIKKYIRRSEEFDKGILGVRKKNDKRSTNKRSQNPPQPLHLLRSSSSYFLFLFIKINFNLIFVFNIYLFLYFFI